MNRSLSALSAFFLAVSLIHAADDPRLAQLQAADDSRIAAIKSADAVALRAIISEDLHYRHSSGTVDTKETFIDSLVSGRAKYVVYDNEERTFHFPAPGIALMGGRAHVKVVTATGGMDSPVSYLAVWREENGAWKFLAWQAGRIPSPAR